jgi:hypothetical protein
MRNPGGFELRRSIAARTPAVGGISTATPFGPDPARVEDIGLWKILVGFVEMISFSCAVIDLMEISAAAGVNATQFESHRWKVINI